MTLVKNTVIFLVEDEIIYAEDLRTGVYGEGATEEEAFVDLKVVLAELQELNGKQVEFYKDAYA